MDKVISVLFNMLSRLVITFLPRSKHLLISWLQSPSAVILEARKIKSATVSTVSPSICNEVILDGLECQLGPWRCPTGSWVVVCSLTLVNAEFQQLLGIKRLKQFHIGGP